MEHIAFSWEIMDSQERLFPEGTGYTESKHKSSVNYETNRA